MMCVIQFVHREGGTATVTADSFDAVKAKAEKACAKYPQAYVAASVPFESSGHRLPAWWRTEGGKELELLALGGG